jgi:predicted GNAT family acetyltransferase
MTADPVQLRLGRYAGIRKAGRLIAIAGTHFIHDRLAMLGTVVTAPAHRRSGYARACLAALAQPLYDAGLTVCLNVDERNTGAAKLYDALRFATRRLTVETDGKLFCRR